MKSYRKKILLLGVVLLLVAGWFTFSPLNAPKASAAAYNGCPAILTENNPNNNQELVQALQFRLNMAHDLLYYNINYPDPVLQTDGSFGPLTKEAVVSFQYYAGIDASGNGQVGYLTWSALGFCQAGMNSVFNTEIYYGYSSSSQCPGELDEGAGSTWVAVLQDLLNLAYAEHAYGTTPDSWTVYLTSDGSFGQQTYYAVYDYQYSMLYYESVSPMTVDGSVGPYTWSALGMCY